MPAILPSIPIDHDPILARFFVLYQIAWIQAEDFFHAQGRQAFALAEKSVRIGWTFADAFKNVRKRLRFKKRDYLFATKDWPSALEYSHLAYAFCELFDYTRAVLTHGEEFVKVPRFDSDGKPTGFTDEIKIGQIKFDNGSRIIAFSSNPRAMAVHGGDVGLDEFAKHPNAKLLWETAQGRVAWGGDLAVWSAHDGEDTLFHQFAQQARAQCSTSSSSSSSFSASSSASTRESSSSSPIIPTLQHSSTPVPVFANQNSKIKNSNTPLLQHSTTPSSSSSGAPRSLWNLYFRVTMSDALELGLLNVMNATKGTRFTPEQFIADCQSRAGSEEVYQQSYMCNPQGTATANIVEWSAIERCRFDYPIERVHLESDQLLQLFGQFNPSTEKARQALIEKFLLEKFPRLFSSSSFENQKSKFKNSPKRLGFDVAASGQGDLAVLYIDDVAARHGLGMGLWLQALLTARTEDWHFLKTTLFFFLQHIPAMQAAGDESGLGRQICWEAATRFPSRFFKVNFASKKQDLGFSLMNQLSVSEKRFPRSHQDIAADYFALRKLYTGTQWLFTESRNTFNPASHCDIAWAGALASHAHTERRLVPGARCA